MGVFALLEGDCAILFLYIFPTHSGIGVRFSAKLGQKRQFCARMRTNWHARSKKTRFLVHKNRLFASFSLFSLFRLIPTARRVVPCLLGVLRANYNTDIVPKENELDMQANQTCEGKPKPKRFRWLRRAYRAGAGLSFLAVLFCAVVMFTPVGVWIARDLVATSDPCPADAIVVLGGSMDRVAWGAQLYHQGHAPLVVVTANGEYVEEMANILRASGVPETAIRIERNSYTTADHPQAVADLLGIAKDRPLLIVTSWSHSARSQACFDKSGFTQARVVIPGWQSLPGERRSTLGFSGGLKTCYELLGWCKYKLAGWV